MRRITIVGAGQAGLHLGIGLVQQGYEVTILSNRTPEQLRDGTVLSSQSMYDMALSLERELGIDFWEDNSPKYRAAAMSIANSAGEVMCEWEGLMDKPGQSIDQRVKMPVWMAHFEKLGGKLVYVDADIDTLEDYATSSDLLLVASGKGAIGQMFERDPSKCVFDKPMRILALTYVEPMKPRNGPPAISININPGIGELVTFPGLTLSGECDIFTIECVPGGPMDCWDDVKTPQQHLETSERLLREFFPREAERIDGNLKLTDDRGILRGRITPTIRKPIGKLPSGALVFGLADAIALNDPLTGQGSNNASKCAKINLDSILERGGKPFDAEWMQQTFDVFWDYARWPTQYTNQVLVPPQPHILDIFKAAGRNPQIGYLMANSFNDPKSIAPWYYDATAAQDFLASMAAAA